MDAMFFMSAGVVSLLGCFMALLGIEQKGFEVCLAQQAGLKHRLANSFPTASLLCRLECLTIAHWALCISLEC